jgi:non-canonical poly(A) RNA polymerase PAPD5/7
MKDQNPFISQTLNTTNKNTCQNNLLIPIELKNQNLKTYLSLSTNDNNNLYIYLNKTSEELKDEISQIKNKLNEHLKLIQNYENILKEKDSKIESLKNSINEKEKEIEIEKNNISIENNKLNELKSSINDLEEYFINTSNQNSKSEFLYHKFSSKSYTEPYIIANIQKDLKDYQEYINEKISYKKPVINDILKELQLTVDEVNPNYKVNLYGSYCTGLCLPWSDIDIVISHDPSYREEYFLNKLYMKLTKKNWVKSHKFIENANVPIIKLVSNDKFNFHIDISVENDKHFGLKTVELVKSYMKTYPVLKPIILALKTLLANGNLNNPYTGGLSSYGLILMVVSYIQSKIENQKYNSESPTILGDTFINVLGYYGIIFKFNKYIIITYPVNNDNINGNDKDLSYSLGNNSHELIIIDPLNKQNNVAKSTFQYMNIKMAFMIAYMVAKEDCECGCHYEGIQNKLSETEHCILKRIFNSVKRFSDVNKQSY